MSAVAVILKGYPRLSETFIARELLALEKRGFDLRLISLRHPTDKARHPVHDEISAPVMYLPEYLHHEPMRVLRAWTSARRLPGYAKAKAIWKRDFERDRTRNRVRRFGQACVLATELPNDVDRLYAHFLHTPASVARYAAIMRGLPWMCSAHAKDIYTSPDWELAEKMADLEWLATCTAHNVEHLGRLPGVEASKINLVYHGLDFSRFPDTPERDEHADPVTILSVGRAVEKKGYPGLLRALSQLPTELDWRLVHIGGGALTNTLQQQASDLGLDDRVDWLGARAQADVFDAYVSSDVFVLNSRIAGDGDRDGLPNVLMEAQAMGLPCVATRVSAIPELIDDGDTGLLVPPDDDAALAQALRRLIEDQALRRRIGNAGHDRVHRMFSMERGIDTLAGLLSDAA